MEPLWDYAWSDDSNKFVIISAKTDGPGPETVDRKSLLVVQKYDIPKPELPSGRIPVIINGNNIFLHPSFLHIDWSRDGSTIAAARMATVYILSPTSAKPISSIEYTPEVLAGNITTFGNGFSGIGLSPDGKRIAISNESGVSVFKGKAGLSFYDLEKSTSDPVCDIQFKQFECLFSWSSNGKAIAVCNGAGRETADVEFVDIRSHRVTHHLHPSRKEMGLGSRLLKWSPDGAELAMLGRGGPLLFWQV